MPSPDSDIDDQLRAAMKVLDGEVPSGYWEALPNLTLARLEDSSMQPGPSGISTTQTAAAPPPVATPPSATDNTEDSGLHDIRNLAQSTKQRLSSKRITTSPPVEDDVASSSAGWKAVALPQPAKMVSLPELAELPSKKEIKAAEKAAAKVQKTAEVEAPAAAPAVSTPARTAFSLPSAQRSTSKKSKGPLYALVGIGIAAAAGAAIFVTTQKKSDTAPAAVAVAQNTATAAPAPTTTTTAAVGGMAAAGSAAAAADVQKAQDEVAKAEADAAAMRAQLAAQPPADTTPPAKSTAPVKAITKKGHGTSKVDTGAAKPEETKKVAPPPPVDTKADKSKQKNADGSEPDFNDLLKEAGVDQNKKEQKPKLDKKSLTGDDFKNGMSSIDSAAHACYKGTQGSAMVKLTIAPSGKISKIAVTGAFAGKPEAACVAAAVRGATFPAWDGGPESFTYPILLSE